MTTSFSRMPQRVLALTLGAAMWLSIQRANALTTEFFSSAQRTNLIASGTTTDTIGSEGYSFTVTRDKLFTGGIGLTNPIGRYIRVPWPTGLEAQAITAGPSPGGAQITISRQDGQRFDIATFTFRLLANTAGAGGSLEIMPMLNGEDGVPDPYMFNATGIAGNQFTYVTPQLTGYDAYKLKLYVDYALMNLTTIDAVPPRPTLAIVPVANALQLSWPLESTNYTLEFATSLPAASWSPVTNSAVTNGDWVSVEVPIPAAPRFFRMRYPSP